MSAQACWQSVRELLGDKNGIPHSMQGSMSAHTEQEVQKDTSLARTHWHFWRFKLSHAHGAQVRERAWLGKYWPPYRHRGRSPQRLEEATWNALVRWRRAEPR